MPAYLTVAEFKTRTVMPGAYVDELESAAPGFLAAMLADQSSWIDDRLRKRYAVPFAAPYPTTVQRWLVRLGTVEAYLRRGWGAQDEQAQMIQAQAGDARDEVREAANSETGLFDLPLRADTTDSGIARSGPLVYSEQSPYVYNDRQVDVGRQEDQNRGGTGG